MPFCKIELKAERPHTPFGYPKTLNTLGDHIRKKRLDLELLQKDVANIIGTTESTIWNWENNYVSPSLSYIPKIIEFLGYIPYDTLNKRLGDKLLIHSKLLGFSQREFALLIGIDPSTLGKWERGKTRPDPDKFAKLIANI